MAVDYKRMGDADQYYAKTKGRKGVVAGVKVTESGESGDGIDGDTVGERDGAVDKKAEECKKTYKQNLQKIDRQYFNTKETEIGPF